MDSSDPPNFRIERLGVVASTNDEARERADIGAAHGLVVVADAQQAGRGRGGRTWVSPPGNVYASFLLRPAVSVGEATQISFVAALAVAESVDTLLPEASPGLKWPNDVLLGGRKISGILLESATDAQGDLGWVIVGIGVNVAHSPQGPGIEATCLAAEGSDASRDDVLAALTSAFERRYRQWNADGFAPIREAWLRRAIGLGQMARLRERAGWFEGVFEDIDEAGAIIVRPLGGEPRRFTFGEVSFRGE